MICSPGSDCSGACVRQPHGSVSPPSAATHTFALHTAPANCGPRAAQSASVEHWTSLPGTITLQARVAAMPRHAAAASAVRSGNLIRSCLEAARRPG